MKLHFAEEGKVFEEVEFSYCYDMASFLQHYAYAFTLTGLSRITGINQGQLSHYINGTSRPSRRTVEKLRLQCIALRHRFTMCALLEICSGQGAD